jgi:hypothetical protein
MSSPIVATLASDASPFKAGDSVKFYCRAGSRFYNPETKKNEWSNYSFVIWASNQNQVDFYTKNLDKGNLVHVSCAALVARVNTDGEGKLWPYIEGVRAQLIAVHELAKRETQEGE